MNPSKVERGTPPWKVAQFSSAKRDWLTTCNTYWPGAESGVIGDESAAADYSDWSGLYIGSGSIIRPSDLYEYESTGGRPCYVLVRTQPAMSPMTNRVMVTADVPTLDAKDLLSSIKNSLNLNVSQLAQVCLVQRPTIYEWLRGTAPRTKNLARLTKLAGIADKYKFSSSSAYKASIEIQNEKTGASVVDLLSQDPLDVQMISQVLDSIRIRQEDTERVSLSEKLRAAGYSELPTEEAEANLDSASDIDFGPTYD